MRLALAIWLAGVVHFAAFAVIYAIAADEAAGEVLLLTGVAFAALGAGWTWAWYHRHGDQLHHRLGHLVFQRSGRVVLKRQDRRMQVRGERQVELGPARIVDDRRTSHLDPLSAAPGRNRFLKTVVPFLRG